MSGTHVMGGFRPLADGEPPDMDHVFYGPPPTNPVLRYMAILSAARDFGVSQLDIEQVARRFDPLKSRPRELADALAEMLPEPADLT